MKDLDDIRVVPENDTARVEDMVKSYFDQAGNVSGQILLLDCCCIVVLRPR